MNNRLNFILFFLLLATSFVVAQKTEVLYLENASFEGRSRPGAAPEGWADCGQPQESPPDIQPYGGFNVTRPAQDGKTYVGMVTRDNKTWEAISQRLTSSLEKGNCYRFSIYACKSSIYISPTRKNQSVPVNFSKGVVLRIWGGNNYCQRAELLAKIDNPVEHIEWKKYKFEFSPKQGSYNFITIEAYYKTPTLSWYNGNILIDNASEIFSCNIPDDAPLVASNTKKRPKIATIREPNKTSMVKKDPFATSTFRKPNTSAENLKLVDKGNFEPEKIDVKKIEVGHLFRLEKLYFPADSSSITPTSQKVLYNLYTFLKKNPTLHIEIGGHTNGLPPDAYCDKLSSARARNVRNYLAREGIKSSRIAYKGYGKKKPISDNKTFAGRRKNQRVEIIVTDIQ